MGSWVLQIHRGTHESPLLDVTGIPSNWDGRPITVVVTGLEDQAAEYVMEWATQPRRSVYQAVGLSRDGQYVALGFLGRDQSELPPTRDEAFQTAIGHLRSFIDTHGHADVPVEYVVDGYALGRWVKNVSTSKGIPPEERAVLDAIPEWTWKD